MKKPKINEWGIFIEDYQGRTFEIKLPDNLSTEVYKFLSKKMTKKDVLGMGKPKATLNECDTKGTIIW